MLDTYKQFTICTEIKGDTPASESLLKSLQCTFFFLKYPKLVFREKLKLLDKTDTMID